MRQALHIFKKDVRHLWFEIAVVITAVAGFTFTGARRALWLVDPKTNRTAAWALVLIVLPLAWWTLIARVIHAETLPGDSQFWISRPYSWKSLLAAKALFIITFINFPMLLADIVILGAYGLHPLRGQLPGLLWSQILLTIVFVLPIATLSAVTTGFVQLIFAVLIPCVIALALAILAPEAVLGGFLGPFEWVRTYYAFLVITIGALAILLWQYSRRRTTAARALTVAVVILGVVGALSIPWPAAFRIQSWFSRRRVESSLVHVDFDSGDPVRAITQGDDRVRIIVPLHITGLPQGTSAKPEGLFMQLEAPDGTIWKPEGTLPITTVLAGHEFAVETTVARAFYTKAKDQPLRIRGSVYLTLFGDPQSSTVPFGGRLVPVERVGVCSASRGVAGAPDFLLCNSAFRFPPAQVSYRFVQSAQGALRTVWSSTQPRPVSYSPFPAGSGIDPVSQDWTFSSANAPYSEASVDTAEPLAHMRRSFGAENIKLSGQ
jgi:hypothetical protein